MNSNILKNFQNLYTNTSKGIKSCARNGFRKNITINMAIYNFLYKIVENVDKRNPLSPLYCYMTQAFGYVNHSILIDKLECYGIRENLLKLL